MFEMIFELLKRPVTSATIFSKSRHSILSRIKKSYSTSFICASSDHASLPEYAYRHATSAALFDGRRCKRSFSLLSREFLDDVIPRKIRRGLNRVDRNSTNYFAAMG